MRTLHSLRLALLLSLILTALAIQAAAPIHIVIMHTSDIHGHIEPDATTGGSAVLATIVRNIKPDLMFDSGDMFTGSLISDKFGGQAVIDVMNDIGYDAVALGNHEFDYGLGVLRARAQQAHFPFLSANTISVDEVHEAAIFNAQGVRIAVIGATTEEVARTGHPKYVQDVHVMDVVKGLEETLPTVRDRADFIVLLAHTTKDEELRIARAFPEIRLIIGGHEHEELNTPVQVGNTTIVRTGGYGKFVGRVDLDFNFDEGSPHIRTQLIPIQGAEPDPEIERILTPYRQKVEQEMTRVFGQAKGDLSRSTSTESHVANLVADAIQWKTGAEIVLLNAGLQRVPIPKGPITGRKLFEVLPFQNTLVRMTMTGAQIKQALGHTVMTVGGVRVRLDSTKPDGSRLAWVRLADGKKLDDRELYSVVTNDFLFAGGDGFKEFADGLNVQDTGAILRDVVGEYISTFGEISPKLDGRIQVLR
jgi:5'-nucleotidase / UDP-sugar diphosphatase